MGYKAAQNVNLPNHGECKNSYPVQVTRRQGKAQERPRNHSCKDCGQTFQIDARTMKAVNWASK